MSLPISLVVVIFVIEIAPLEACCLVVRILLAILRHVVAWIMHPTTAIELIVEVNYEIVYFQTGHLAELLSEFYSLFQHPT